MKLYCDVCKDFHIDKDGYPDCDYLSRQGFSKLSEEDKLRVWEQYIMNPLMDELTVKYNISPMFSIRAFDSVALKLESGRIIYLPINGLTGLLIKEKDVYDTGV